MSEAIEQRRCHLGICKNDGHSLKLRLVVMTTLVVVERVQQIEMTTSRIASISAFSHPIRMAESYCCNYLGCIPKHASNGTNDVPGHCQRASLQDR